MVIVEIISVIIAIIIVINFKTITLVFVMVTKNITTIVSKRAHLRVLALQTSPKFHAKTPEREKERQWRREREK